MRHGLRWLWRPPPAAVPAVLDGLVNGVCMLAGGLVAIGWLVAHGADLGIGFALGFAVCPVVGTVAEIPHAVRRAPVRYEDLAPTMRIAPAREVPARLARGLWYLPLAIVAAAGWAPIAGLMCGLGATTLVTAMVQGHRERRLGVQLWSAPSEHRVNLTYATPATG